MHARHSHSQMQTCENMNTSTGLQTYTQEDGEAEFTDSRSCPILITWGIDGEEGILGMKRERSATDASLIASSSTNELIGKSYTISNNQINIKTLKHVHVNRDKPRQVEEVSHLHYRLLCSPRMS